MRKGSKRRDWSVSDINYLIKHAGRVPKRDVCKHLRRSSKSVGRKAAQLREQGEPITLRCHVQRMHTCPGCGCMRSRFGKEGICEPCRRRAQLIVIHGRIAELMTLLPADELAKYEETEAETESGIDPKPLPPRMAANASHYTRKCTSEQYDKALEIWTVGNLKREIKAVQKRKERIEKKVKSMGLLT